jgi:guanosine-3',5'-bis(diphosphate) 3'-pyrophosphohydrolase
MTTSLAETHRPLLEAIAFAARAHRGQVRKDKETPYASHAFRVCLILRHVFGVDASAVLTAAVLHDTVEDTNTDFDDIDDRFGTEIAGWVAALSKDKRLGFDEREAAYCQALAAAPWQVQVCKLADVFDNLLDSGYLTPDRQPKAFENKRRYLDAIRAGVKPEASRALQLTTELYEELRSAQR